MSLKKTYYFFRLFYNLSKIARDEKNTEAALDIGICLHGLGLLQAEIDKVGEEAEGANSFKNRTLLKSKPDLHQLHTLPTNTLGYAYAHHMISQNLEPDFYKPVQVKDEMSYAIMRMRETHDLWHVITGFKTDVPGELGLQAFMYAQIHTAFAPIVISGRCLVSVFKNPKEVLEIFEQIARGWLMGRQARPIFALDWEANWQKSLNEIRAQYNVVAL